MEQLESVASFDSLKRNLRRHSPDLFKIKIALLGDSSTQLLHQALKGHGVDQGYLFEIYEADFDQIETEVLDKSSTLYKFEPEFVIIFQSAQTLQTKFYKSERRGFWEEHLTQVETLYNTLTASLNTSVLFFNFPEINDGIFGSFANKLDTSFLYQLRRINVELMHLSMKCKKLNILDFSFISAQFGRRAAFDPRLYYTAGMTVSIEILPWVAKHITDIISALRGKLKKCLVFDLDNTVWGGIIGDDGLERIEIGNLKIGKAYSDLQLWIKQLRERGIILAVCSKNLESVAKEPFEKHPDMLLRLEDIAIFIANWETKAQNVQVIQRALNIGYDSIVFLDDNPFEREMVRRHCPTVVTPDLPEDPALFLEYLRSLNLWEVAAISEEDKRRTNQYREESERAEAQKCFVNESQFLASLNMVSEAKPFDEFSLPRIVQLSQRSNQFNLRTIRYTEEDVVRLIASEHHLSLSFSLKDRFGDSGIVSLVVLERQQNALFIENWLMSCRVLKRGLEDFVLNSIVRVAREQGLYHVLGEYIATSKNMLVRDHYKHLGFTEANGRWKLDVAAYSDRPCFILPLL